MSLFPESFGRVRRLRFWRLGRNGASSDRPIDLRSPPLGISANVSDDAIEGSRKGTTNKNFGSFG